MNSLRPVERRGGRNFYELRSAAHFGAPENPVVRTKTILSQFVASVQLTGVPLHVAIGEVEFGGDVGVGQTIGMGCEKFQDRELPFLRARHAGNCSTRSYSGVLFARRTIPTRDRDSASAIFYRKFSRNHIRHRHLRNSRLLVRLRSTHDRRCRQRWDRDPCTSGDHAASQHGNVLRASKRHRDRG